MTIRHGVTAALIGFAVLGALATAAQAQTTTCRPRFGGGSTCFSSDGTSIYTPRFGGGYRRSDSDGGSATITPRFGGGYTIHEYPAPRQRHMNQDRPYRPHRYGR